jgi:processing peptidase subunit alpha
MAASKTAMSRLLVATQRATTSSSKSVAVSGVIQRSLSSNSSDDSMFSNYIYPLRTEAPEITRTTAAEAAAAREKETSIPPLEPEKLGERLRLSQEETDRFDDLAYLSPAQREDVKDQLKQQWKTSLKGSTKIEPTVPAHIPPNVPATELAVPKTEITTLDNGIRVVSQETYGQVSTIGVVADVGSRHEPQLGVAHLWELCAFSSTEQYPSAMDLQEMLQDWGGTRFVNTGREQSLVCIDILRPNVEKAMHVLQQVLLHPQFLPIEVEDAKRTMEFQALDLPPELVVEEALQMAAYGLDQQLGKPHFCPMEALADLNADVLKDFWNHNVLANPQDIVIGGAGIGHDQLVDLAHKEFGDWPTAKEVGPSIAHEERTIPSVYRGGEHWVEKPSEDGFTRVALAFELDGWHSKDLVPTCVLQTLLGGGNSFSAGGPGKGMYSRLYRQVLNRYSWAESAEAFTSIHAESGLWGITGSSKPKHSRDVLHVLADHVARLSLDLVSDEELDRARNMLKCNVLTQLESRLVLFEDLGRQVLTYGTREDMDTTCRKIDAVTKEELRELARKALKKAPTVAVVGENLQESNIPSQQEVKQWFHGVSSSS